MPDNVLRSGLVNFAELSSSINTLSAISLASAEATRFFRIYTSLKFQYHVDVFIVTIVEHLDFSRKSHRAPRA